MSNIEKWLGEKTVKWLMQLLVVMFCYMFIFDTDVEGLTFISHCLIVFVGLKIFNRLEHFKIIWKE